MKGLVTFIGGVAVGAIAGLLLAPEKGVDLRERIKALLKKNGIIPSNEIDILLEEITSDVENSGFDEARRPETDEEE